MYNSIIEFIEKDTTKIDSVLAVKVDTTKDLRITAIVLADSLTTCKENLADANKELAHKDTVIADISKINKEPIKKELDYKLSYPTKIKKL